MDVSFSRTRLWLAELNKWMTHLKESKSGNCQLLIGFYYESCTWNENSFASKINLSYSLFLESRWHSNVIFLVTRSFGSNSIFAKWKLFISAGQLSPTLQAIVWAPFSNSWMFTINRAQSGSLSRHQNPGRAQNLRIGPFSISFEIYTGGGL